MEQKLLILKTRQLYKNDRAVFCLLGDVKVTMTIYICCTVSNVCYIRMYMYMSMCLYMNLVQVVPRSLRQSYCHQHSQSNLGKVGNKVPTVQIPAQQFMRRHNLGITQIFCWCLMLTFKQSFHAFLDFVLMPNTIQTIIPFLLFVTLC